jgi:hypothetical protein
MIDDLPVDDRPIEERLVDALNRQADLVDRVEVLAARDRRRRVTMIAFGLLSIAVALLALNAYRVASDRAHDQDVALRTACVQRNGFQVGIREQVADFGKGLLDAFDSLVTTPQAHDGVAQLRAKIATSVHSPAQDDRDCNQDGELDAADYPPDLSAPGP